MSQALVPLQSKNRMTYLVRGLSVIIFDNVRCCFIFPPEWVVAPLGENMKSRNEVKAQSDLDFEEMEQLIKEFKKFQVQYRRCFADAYGIPYDFMDSVSYAPTLKAREEGV